MPHGKRKPRPFPGSFFRVETNASLSYFHSTIESTDERCCTYYVSGAVLGSGNRVVNQ